MRIKEVITEAAVWKSNRVPNAPAQQTPATIARPVRAPVAKSNVPGNFRKNLYKLTGLGGNAVVNSAVAKDNFIKKFSADFEMASQDQTGAFNPKDYLNSIITQNNWGPLTTQQQLALDSAVRTNDPIKISTVMYQIGKQNRGGSSVQRKQNAQTAQQVVKSTTGKPDDLSTNTDAIMSKIQMMGNTNNVDDLEAICRAAMGVLYKVAPSQYSAFVKQLVTGQKPQQQHPADDNPNINLGYNE